MNKSATALFILLLPLGLGSCTSTGGPSGGVLGLVTGGLLGHLVDDNSNDNNSSSGGLFSNNNNNSGSNSSGSGSSVTPLLLGTTTTNSTDPTTGTTTEAIKNQYAVVNANGNGNNEDDFFGRNKGAIVGAAAGAISGMVTDSFRKGEIQKKYDEGYAKAKSDAIKEFYWLKRDAQKSKAGGEDNPVQYRYYEVEVPAHTTSDGVFIDKHRRVIEVVE